MPTNSEYPLSSLLVPQEKSKHSQKARKQSFYFASVGDNAHGPRAPGRSASTIVRPVSRPAARPTVPGSPSTTKCKRAHRSSSSDKLIKAEATDFVPLQITQYVHSAFKVGQYDSGDFLSSPLVPEEKSKQTPKTRKESKKRATMNENEIRSRAPNRSTSLLVGTVGRSGTPSKSDGGQRRSVEKYDTTDDK